MRADGRQGFALVAVLAVLALLSSLLLAMVLTSRNAVENAAVATSDLQMDSLLRSAVTVAAYQLFVLKLPPPKVNNGRLALNAGTATVRVSDDSGKVDLNGAEPALLETAWRAAGLADLSAENFAARVADWRDSDETLSKGGAEASDYRRAQMPPPRNGPFRAVSDLRSVLGVSGSDVAALAPFITIYNPSGRIDPYAASHSLLNQLPGVTPAIRSQTAALTKNPRSEENDTALRKLLADQQELLDFDPATIVRLSVEAVLDGFPHRKRVSVLAAASNTNAFRIADWQEW